MAADTTTYLVEHAEDRGAPDTTSVTVSNDEAELITFRVVTPNHARLTRDMRVRIQLWARGVQWFLLVDPLKPKGGEIGLHRCHERATDTVCLMHASASLRFRYVGGARFAFDLSEIGIAPAAGTRTPIRFYATVSRAARSRSRPSP